MAITRVNDGFKHKMQRGALDNFINRCFNNPGIVSGILSANIALTYATEYCIEGYIYSAAAVASGRYLPQGSGYSTLASGKARMFAVCLDSVGSIHIYAGSAVSAGTTTYAPDVPTSKCCIGLVKVSCASNFSFTVGDMGWGSASILSTTMEMWNVSQIPQGVILSE